MMKQMILLLVAVYSLILNQSSKHFGNKNQETGKINSNTNAAGKIDPRPQTKPPVRKSTVMFTKSNYLLYEETNSAR
jgi:hypothetical protein